MKTPLIGILLSLAAAVTAADLAGNKDPDLFTRIPGYFLSARDAVLDKAFDAHPFMVDTGGKKAPQSIEGHYTRYSYNFDRTSGSALPSPLQIMRNYQAAAARIGGKTLYQDFYKTTIQIVKDGKEIWTEVNPFNNGGGYHLTIVERQAMKQDVAANAQVFDAGLKESGHVEVPGILFDTGKADVKPESEAALKEVVKLMQGNPSLKVWVVGHTDNVGTPENNLALSSARAAAVVKALASMGIDARRLGPHGAGQFAPVATNATDEGRARNRRVELVSQ